MKTLDLKGTKRTGFGKKESKQIRREGQTPCVIYGGGETVHFSVDVTDLKDLIYTEHSYIVNFDIEGKKETGVMREVQYHPTNDMILHIDFYRLTEGKPVAIDLPVKLVGNSEGVKMGGKLSLSKRKVRVSALVKNLPDELVVDVTNLTLGKSIFVGDLKYEGLDILSPATTALCAVRMTRAARGAAAAAASEK